jgi:hypothetical protein
MVLFNVYAAANHPQISKLAIRQERKEGRGREGAERRGEAVVVPVSLIFCLFGLQSYFEF